MKHLLFLAAALVFVSGFAGCAKKSDQLTTGVDGDYVVGTPLSERRDGSAFFSDKVIKGKFEPVYFAYDSFEVSDQQLVNVGQVADALRGMKNDIIIAGFTDDRGTEEYNRVLGEKRALAVRQALIGLGVNAGRIQTVSFGMEMPADPGSGDAAWAKNRRAEFGIIK